MLAKVHWLEIMETLSAQLGMKEAQSRLWEAYIEKSFHILSMVLQPATGNVR